GAGRRHAVGDGRGVPEPGRRPRHGAAAARRGDAAGGEPGQLPGPRLPLRDAADRDGQPDAPAHRAVPVRLPERRRVPERPGEPELMRGPVRRLGGVAVLLLAVAPGPAGAASVPPSLALRPNCGPAGGGPSPLPSGSTPIYTIEVIGRGLPP